MCFHGAHGTIGIVLVVGVIAMRILMRRGFGGHAAAVAGAAAGARSSRAFYPAVRER